VSLAHYSIFGASRHTGRGRRGKKGPVQRKDEILAKLEQIQEQAQLTLDELPLRLAKDRLRLIIGLARYLSTTVDVNWQDELSAAAAEDAAKRPLAAPRA
jgi:hypothetical protein